jgi:hypothetical protein
LSPGHGICCLAWMVKLVQNCYYLDLHCRSNARNSVMLQPDQLSRFVFCWSILELSIK